MAHLLEQLDDAFESVTEETCSGLIKKVREVEDKFWTEDVRLDRCQETVSIHMTWTIVKPLPASVLRPRRHSEQQHLFQAPHTIGQARSHRRGARPPLFGRAAAVGGLGLRQGLAYARVGQAEIVVTMEH